MLSQDEADRLIREPKRCVPIGSRLPKLTLRHGEQEQMQVALTGLPWEVLFVDVQRKVIDPARWTFQLRFDHTVLLRYENRGRPHVNPDGESVRCPHLHRYVEGDEIRWASSAPDGLLPTSRNVGDAFLAFLEYCNVEDRPVIQQLLEA